MKKSVFIITSLFTATFVLGQSVNKMQTLLDEGIKLYNHADLYGAIDKWEQGLEIAKKTEHRQAISLFIGNLGLVYDDLGDYQKALAYYEQALGIDKEIGDKKGIGDNLNNIGVVYQNLGDYQKALGYHEQALAIKREVDDKKGMGNGLSNIGTIYRHLGDHQTALAHYEQGLAIYREIGDKRGEAAALTNIGAVYDDLSDYQKALGYYEQTLPIYREIGDKKSEGVVLTYIGNVYNILDGYHKALSYYEQALDIAKEIGNKKEVENNLANMAIICQDLGDYQKALNYYDQALVISREIRDRASIGHNLTNIGLIYSNLSEYQKALGYYEQGLVIANEIDDKQASTYILSNMGDIYQHFGEYKKALGFYEQALVIVKEIDDKKANGYILNNMGDVFQNLGDYQKSLKYYEQALAILSELVDKQGIMDNINSIGVVYQGLGDYQKALGYYEPALAIASEIGDKEGIGTCLNNIGLVYWNLGENQKALGYYEQALTINENIGDKKSEGANLTHIGTIYCNSGEYQKALDYYERALAINKAIGEKKGQAADLANIGAVYWNLDNYQKALDYYEQGLVINQEMAYKQGIAENLSNIGIVWWNLGNYQKALGYYEQALSIQQEIGDSKGIGNSLTNIGVFYKDLGDCQKAVAYYEQALALQREIGDNNGIGNNLMNIGLVYQHLGDYPRALTYYEQALIIRQESGVPVWSEMANIATLWLKIGEIAKAEKVLISGNDPIRLGILNLVKRNYEQAVAYFEKSLERILQNRNVVFLFAAYAGLGAGYEGKKDPARAIANYEKAMALVEEQRESLSEAEKANFFAAEVMNFKRIAPYEGLVRVLCANNNPQQAFFYAENLKGRVLAEVIARGHAVQAENLPANLAQEEQDYLSQIRGLRKQMEALYKNNAMDTYYEKEAELKQVKAEQQQFIARLRQSHPEYVAIHYPQSIKPQEVLLNPSEVLIEFEVTDNATLVFLLKDKQVKTKSIDIARDSLEQLVLNYRGYFVNIRQTSQLGKYDPKVGNKLYELLFGDLLASIPAGTALIIVADEFFGILPFEALVTELPAAEKMGESEFGPFPLGVRYLGDSYPISYAQSATSLTLLRTLKKSGGKGEQMLVVADPIFSVNDSRLGALAQAKMSEDKMNLMGALVDWKQMGVKGIRLREEQRAVAVDADAIFPRLEKTTVLAQSVQALFGKNAVVFSGSQASEEKIRATDLSQYRYLTFATHGILDRTVPYILEPALVLTQVGNPEGYDGFLTMTEVMGLKLEAEVVALTACETGVGKRVSGEGVMGMGRAFQYAGAQNVLVSLWSVAETSATDLTATFFSYVKEGKEPKEAMRLARNEIRRKGYEHPFYWASFILFGK